MARNHFTSHSQRLSSGASSPSTTTVQPAVESCIQTTSSSYLRLRSRDADRGGHVSRGGQVRRPEGNYCKWTMGAPGLERRCNEASFRLGDGKAASSATNPLPGPAQRLETEYPVVGSSFDDCHAIPAVRQKPDHQRPEEHEAVERKRPGGFLDRQSDGEDGDEHEPQVHERD